MIKTIAKPADKKVTGCGECRSTCQSACKTSCTVGNQSCERITREEKIERKYFFLGKHGRISDDNAGNDRKRRIVTVRRF